MISSTQVSDDPSNIPRVKSNTAQYGSFLDNSSESPEPKEVLCFQFKKKQNKEMKTPLMSRKSNTVHKFKSGGPLMPGPSQGSPPGSPGQVRIPSPTTSLGNHDAMSAKLPDVVVNYSAGKNTAVVPTRNTRTHSGDNLNIQQLQGDNIRLREIVKETSIPQASKSNMSTKSKVNISENKKSDEKTGKGKQEHIKTKPNISKTFNCMASDNASYHEETTISSQFDLRNNVESGGKKRTTVKTETKTVEKVKTKENTPVSHRSHSNEQGSAPSTPGQNKRRMSRTGVKGSRGSQKQPGHTSSPYRSKTSSQQETPGFVFLNSNGQVLAQSLGNSSHVIVKNVRSSVFEGQEAEEDVDAEEEEFEVDKILASQRLHEISMRMEKNKIMN